MLLTKKDLILLALKKKSKNIPMIYYTLKTLSIASNFIHLSLIVLAQPLYQIQWSLSYKLNLKTFHLNMLDSFVLKLTENLTNWLEKDQIQIRYLKQEHTKLTVLRSPFVYKKTREQFAKTQYGVLLWLNLESSNLFYSDYFIQNTLVKVNKSSISKLDFIEVQLKN